MSEQNEVLRRFLPSFHFQVLNLSGNEKNLNCFIKEHTDQRCKWCKLFDYLPNIYLVTLAQYKRLY